MLLIGPKARVNGLRPELWGAATIAASVWTKYNADFVIVHALDGTHMGASLHYVGAAIDGRMKNIVNPDDRRVAIAALTVALGADYDILYEGEGTENEHVHIEFQPKTAINI